jgi:hypothetical protein
MKEHMRLSLVLQMVKGEEVSSFSRGHITVHGSQKNISSIGHLRDQSMMIFLSIVQLLDGIRHLSESDEDFRFVGEGSSFQFFVKLRDQLICVEDTNGDVVGETRLDEFVIQLLKEVERLITTNSSLLCEEEIIYFDLQDSISQFKVKFKL